MRNFLWGDQEDKRKDHLVSWGPPYINPSPRRASGMWKAILVCVDKCKEGIRFKAERGDKIEFWIEP